MLLGSFGSRLNCRGLELACEIVGRVEKHGEVVHLVLGFGREVAADHTLAGGGPMRQLLDVAVVGDVGGLAQALDFHGCAAAAEVRQRVAVLARTQR